MASVNRMSIVQHNVLHWSFNRRNELSNLYYQLDPDVILLNSTGIKDENKIKIFGYILYQRNITGELNDGVAVAIRCNLRHRILLDFEDSVLAVEIETTRGPIIICTMYLPPRRPYLPEQDLNKLLRRRKPIYIIGDLNARHAILGHGNENNVGSALYDNISRGKLKHLGPDFPTLIRRVSATTPDIILSNNEAILNMHITAGPISTSDHLPIVLTLSHNPIMIPTKIRSNFKRANWELFKENLSHKAGRNLDGSNTGDIDEELQHWYNDVLSEIGLSIPTTSYRTIPHSHSSHALRQLLVQYENVQQLASIRGWTQELRGRFRDLQGEIQIESKELHDLKWAALVQEAANNYRDSSSFWKSIKRLMGSTSASLPYLINENNEKIFKDEEQEYLHRRYLQKIFTISDEENEYFDRQFEEETLHELEDNELLLQAFDRVDFSRLTEDTYLSACITTADVLSVIKASRNKSPGESQINRKIMSNLPLNMIERLTHIFNACLASGHFPYSFKVAIIRLIPKAGKTPNKVENFRPISLLEVPAKILEKIINLRLRQHLEDEEIHNPRQFGFRQFRGTSTAIAQAYEQIANAMSGKQQCNIVLRDVSKAFDKVWHDGLRVKIIRLGLPENLTRLLCDFISGRKAKIKINDYVGESFLLRSGVPQGSCLSPTLYTLYTADMSPPVANSEYIMYADDVSQIITYAGSSTRMMARCTERAIEEISHYEKKWKIKTNKAKFEVIPIAKFKPAPLIVENENIIYSKVGKLLGLTITPRGITTHVNKRLKQAKVTASKLNRFKLLPLKIKVHLYKALVRPVIEYPPIPLITLSKTKLQQLQSFQNKSLRFASGQTPPYHENMESIHIRTNTEPLNMRFHRLGTKTWDKLLDDPSSPDHLRGEDMQLDRNHAWWPRSLPLIQRPVPRPIYILD